MICLIRTISGTCLNQQCQQMNPLLPAGVRYTRLGRRSLSPMTLSKKWIANNSLIYILREALSAAYANQDDEYMIRAGALWRDLAHAIKQREMKLQEFQDFLFEQAEPQRFWSRGYCPVREENRREAIRIDLKAKTRKVEVLLDELEPKIGMEVPWLNRSYREKLQKDEIEAFFFVHHSLRPDLSVSTYPNLLLVLKQTVIQSLNVKFCIS